MTALAAARPTTTKRAIGDEIRHELGQKGSTTCYQGGIAVLNGGYLAPATTATGLVAVGVFEETSANAGADGVSTAKTQSGIFGPFGNSTSGDLITVADRGKTCYLVDDQTVAKTDNSGARSAAGFVYDVDANGVWIDFHYGR
jgi:hypothetical protein